MSSVTVLDFMRRTPDCDFRWLGRYAFLLFLEITAYAIATCYYYAGTIRASRKINDLLVDSILSSTLRYVEVRFCHDDLHYLTFRKLAR